MPAYNSPQPGGVLTDLRPGDPLYYLWNAETPAAGTASVAFCRGQSPSGSDEGMTFQMSWAVAPTGTVVIQGANQDIDALYETLWTSTSTQLDNYTDTTRRTFYRAKLVEYAAGGALTVSVKR